MSNLTQASLPGIDLDTVSAAVRSQCIEAEAKLRKARTGVILDCTLLAEGTLKLQIFASYALPTMGVDGKFMFYNPDFVLKLPKDELKGVVAHEVFHCLFCHHVRLGNRNPYGFNIACDYAINPILVDHGFVLPSEALLKDIYRGLHAEAIYAQLQQEQEEKEEEPEPEDGDDESSDSGETGDSGDTENDDGTESEGDGEEGATQDGSEGDGGDEGEDEQSDAGNESGSEGDSGDESDGPSANGEQEDGGEASSEKSDGSGSSGESVVDFGGTGCVMQAPVDDQSERQQEENEWKITLARSVAMAQARGELKGDALRLVDELVNPKADWREILRRFMDQFSKSDYTWSKGNRRFIANGMYLPSLHDESIGPFCYVIDASGSMPEKSLTEAMSELQAAMDELHPEYVDVVVHDTDVRETKRFYPGDDLREIQVRAGGGTSFSPVVQHINEQPEDYSVVVWFTDLYADVGSVKELESPLVWIDYACRGEEAAQGVGDEYVELIPEDL